MIENKAFDNYDSIFTAEIAGVVETTIKDFWSGCGSARIFSNLMPFLEAGGNYDFIEPRESTVICIFSKLSNSFIIKYYYYPNLMNQLLLSYAQSLEGLTANTAVKKTVLFRNGSWWRIILHVPNTDLSLVLTSYETPEKNHYFLINI